jgi:hypothetical protein
MRIGSTNHFLLTSSQPSEKKRRVGGGESKFSEVMDGTSPASSIEISTKRFSSTSGKLAKGTRHRIFEKIVNRLEDKSHPYYEVGAAVRKDMQSQILELLDHSHYLTS